MIFADYHTHTIMSHGKCTPREVAEAALRAGLSCVAISEHGPSMSYGLSPTRFCELKRETEQLNREYAGRIKVLFGVEANFTGNGMLDIPEGIDFDLVTAGYHRSIPLKNAFAVSAFVQSFTPFSSVEKNTDEIIKTLRNYPQVRILAHPNEYIRLDIKRVATECARLGVLMEINNKHVSMSVEDLRLAAECGAKFVIGSDGHTAAQMCRFEAATVRAKAAGVLDLVENMKI